MLKTIKERINRGMLLASLLGGTLLLMMIFLFMQLNSIEQQVKQVEHVLKTELEQVYALLEEGHQDILNLNDRTQHLIDHHKDIFESLNQLKSMQESLGQMINHQFIPLDEKLKALTQTTTEPTTPADAAPEQKHLLPAPGYKIFGVQPYGVIISTPEGKFVIARIGQSLGNLGVVTSIAAQKIIVGNSIITERSTSQ